MEVSTVFYICTNCVFTFWAELVLWRLKCHLYHFFEKKIVKRCVLFINDFFFKLSDMLVSEENSFSHYPFRILRLKMYRPEDINENVTSYGNHH